MPNPTLDVKDRGHQGHLCNSLLMLLISLSVFIDGVVVWSCCSDGTVHRLLQGCTSKLLAHSCIRLVPSSDDVVDCDDVSAAGSDVAVSVTDSTISVATICWSCTDSRDMLLTGFWASAIDAGVVASGDLAVCGVVSIVTSDGGSGSGCSGASAEGGVATGDSASLGGS